MEKVIRNVKTNQEEQYSIIHDCASYMQMMWYFWDMQCYIAETAEDMTTVASQIGLNTNVSKTKCMIT